jgi:MYXO-CTERM domain-containing protein
MLDDYGDGGVEMFDTWVLFGDPSLRVVGVVLPPSGISVKPYRGLQAAGPSGGPFDPSEVVYTVHNYSSTAVDLEVRFAVPWISVAPTLGTIEPDAELDITVSINDYAALLADGSYADTIEFVNTTDHDGDTTRAVSVVVGEPTAAYSWPLDEDPGWTVEGAWAFGAPLGGGGEYGSPDPTSGHTGEFVYGYNLAGSYAPGIPAHDLTTTAIDCTGLHDVSLHFWRWLGVESSWFDHAVVSVSTDGEIWSSVWENSDTVDDSGWVEQQIDLSEYADDQPTLYLRWTMGPVDTYIEYCGWNIDDIELRARPAGSCWDFDADTHTDAACGGDDCGDLDPAIYPNATEDCTNGLDDDCDGLGDAEEAECQSTGGAGGGGAGAAGAGGTGAVGADGGAGNGTAGDGGLAPGSPPAAAPADEDDGCGCRIGRTDRAAGGALGAVGVLLLGAFRRRRARPLQALARDATTGG